MKAVFVAEKCGETGYAPVAGRGLLAVAGSGVTRSRGIDVTRLQAPAGACGMDRNARLPDASMFAPARSPAAHRADHGWGEEEVGLRSRGGFTMV